MRRIFVLCGLFLFFSSVAYAEDVRVAFGMSIPPYVIADENRGIEYDIIKEALAHKGHILKPVYMPFVEVKDVFLDGRAEAIATLKKTVGVEGYYSESVIVYQNYAISLEKNNVVVNNISDLKDKKVIAFQLATQYLGTEFADMAKSNPHYREKSEQEKQAELLFQGRADVIISDKNIFKFFAKKISKSVDIEQPIHYHNVFEKNEYSVAFKDLKLREDFNAGLKFLRDSGRYDEIVNSYIN